MSSPFTVRKAKRQRRPLKVSLEGLSGSGKTYTALRLAFAMRRAGIGSRIVVADSENESADLYDGITEDGEKWEYETCPIPTAQRNPAGYTSAYEHLVSQGFDIVIFDSLTHAWHGAMERIDTLSRANRGDKFGAWAVVTPEQRKMLDALTDPRAHLIGTMRVKSEYDMVLNERTGKEQRKKVGTKTDQREGSEYEFDAVVRIDPGNHTAVVEKVRGCVAMDGAWAERPGPAFWKPLFDWWLSAPVAEPRQQTDSPQQPPAKPTPAADDAETVAALFKQLADAEGIETCLMLQRFFAAAKWEVSSLDELSPGQVVTACKAARAKLSTLPTSKGTANAPAT